MGEILVHEFMSLDGVIDAPVWTVPEDAPPRKFSLARTDSYDSGVIYLAYRPTEED